MLTISDYVCFPFSLLPSSYLFIPTHCRDSGEWRRKCSIILLFVFFFSSRKQETCALSKMSEPEKWLLTHTVHGWLAWLGLAWLSLAWLHASWCSLLLKTLLCVLTVESIKKFEYRILCCHDITNILYWMFNNSVNKKMAHKKSLLNINWNISAKFSAFVIFGSHTGTCTRTARSLRTSTATDEWSVN